MIRPAIDPFSPKNQEMSDETVSAILVHVGLVEGPADHGGRGFLRDDGSPGRVDRGADVVRMGRAPAMGHPARRPGVALGPAQGPGRACCRASRAWTPARSSARRTSSSPARPYAGVADDPDGPAVFAEVTTAWRALPHERRRRVQIAALPMADPVENAAIVNALQRHAAVVVQKSLAEGFGLTVTEAMWKGRPVVASAVGGIGDQIEDGRDGILLSDPRDLDAFAGALRRAPRRSGASPGGSARRRASGRAASSWGCASSLTMPSSSRSWCGLGDRLSGGLGGGPDGVRETRGPIPCRGRRGTAARRRRWRCRSGDVLGTRTCTAPPRPRGERAPRAAGWAPGGPGRSASPRSSAALVRPTPRQAVVVPRARAVTEPPAGGSRRSSRAGGGRRRPPRPSPCTPNRGPSPNPAGSAG